MLKAKILLIVGCIFALCSIVFASSSANDTLGIVGKAIYEALEKVPYIGASGAALALFVLGFAIRAIGNIILKRTTTVWGKAGVNILWRMVAFLFGKSVILTNTKIPEKLPETVKTEVQAKVKEAIIKDLKKRYPLLNIEIKS